MKLLETSAESEILMAGMSSKQLSFFASYKAKLEANRQTDMKKSIEKALEAAGLSERKVTPFPRLRVVGLTNRCHQQKYCSHEGLMTIWYPTEKQNRSCARGKHILLEVLHRLVLIRALFIYKQDDQVALGHLSPVKMETFELFFIPRSPVTISNLGEVSLCRLI